MTPFRAIFIFHQVATLNSVSAAAEKLGVTPSAVSQQLRALEEQIGMSLVMRVGRHICLTEAGEHYFELIADQVETIISSTQLMKGSKAATLLTVRASPSICTKWILPRLRRFLDANLDINVKLEDTGEPADFTCEDVDLEIRHGAGVWPELCVEPLAIERFMPVCSPDLAAPFSLDPAELLEFRKIRSVESDIKWDQWFSNFSHAEIDVRNHLTVDRSYMAIDAAVLGMGIALESNLLMGEELRYGKLVIPARNVPEILISTQWLVWPHTHMRRNCVRRFVKWLRGEASHWQTASDTMSAGSVKPLMKQKSRPASPHGAGEKPSPTKLASAKDSAAGLQQSSPVSRPAARTLPVTTEAENSSSTQSATPPSSCSGSELK